MSGPSKKHETIVQELYYDFRDRQKEIRYETPWIFEGTDLVPAAFIKLIGILANEVCSPTYVDKRANFIRYAAMSAVIERHGLEDEVGRVSEGIRDLYRAKYKSSNAEPRNKKKGGNKDVEVDKQVET